MANVLKLIPNILTFLRIVLIPVVIVLLALGKTYPALIIFIIAAVTDFLDGLLARYFHAVTNFGKLMDPIADKILVISTLIMLVGMRSDLTGSAYVPAWMVVLVVAREIWVTGLRAIAAANGIVVPADFWGKVKSALQLVAVCFLIYHVPVALIGSPIQAQFVGELLLLISLFASYWGAVGYSKAILQKHL